MTSLILLAARGHWWILRSREGGMIKEGAQDEDGATGRGRISSLWNARKLTWETANVIEFTREVHKHLLTHFFFFINSMFLKVVKCLLRMLSPNSASPVSASSYHLAMRDNLSALAALGNTGVCRSASLLTSSPYPTASMVI